MNNMNQKSHEHPGNRLRNTLILTILCAMALCGCIPVEDIDPAWSNGQMDPALLGSWKEANPEVALKTNFITFAKRKTAYQFKMRGASTPEIVDLSELPPPFCRTLETSGVNFLIFDIRPTVTALVAERSQGMPPGSVTTDTEAIKGGIWRYEATSQTLDLYRLNDQRLSNAIKSGKLKGSPDGRSLPARLTRLDDSTLQELVTMLATPDAWELNQYLRIDDVDAELSKAREYPATTSTMDARQVTINAPAFQEVTHRPDNPLRRQLQASPEWFVYQEGQTDIVADRRKNENGIWYEQSSGYTNEGRTQTRQRFRFTTESTMQNPVKSTISGFADITTNASATEGTIPLVMRKTTQGIESYLTIGYPGTWFEYFEQSPAEPRTNTRKAVDWLTAFTTEIQQNSATVTSLGYLPNTLPAEVIHHGLPSIKVQDDILTAYINPGQQGFVFLKAVDNATSTPLEEKFVEFGAKEYIGWSTDPNTQFLYQKDLRSLIWHLQETHQTVTLQLWSRPCTGVAGKLWYDKDSPSDRLLLEITISK